MLRPVPGVQSSLSSLVVTTCIISLYSIIRGNRTDVSADDPASLLWLSSEYRVSWLWILFLSRTKTWRDKRKINQILRSDDSEWQTLLAIWLPSPWSEPFYIFKWNRLSITDSSTSQKSCLIVSQSLLSLLIVAWSNIASDLLRGERGGEGGTEV